MVRRSRHAAAGAGKAAAALAAFAGAVVLPTLIRRLRGEHRSAIPQAETELPPRQPAVMDLPHEPVATEPPLPTPTVAVSGDDSIPAPSDALPSGGSDAFDDSSESSLRGR